MAHVTIPNRPAPTDTRHINDILADFDAITTQLNGNIDSTNLSSSINALLASGPTSAAAAAASAATASSQATAAAASSSAAVTAADAALAAVGTPFRLVPMTFVASGSVASGQLAVVSPGVVVTMPAPSLGATVGMFADNSVTSATPGKLSSVTNGGGMYGEALVGASQCFLGTPGTLIIFESDGTSWLQIAGRQDTGWVDLSGVILNGWDSIWGPQCRLRGGHVSIRGQIVTNKPSGTQLVNLGAAFAPPIHDVNRPFVTDTLSLGMLSIGAVTANVYPFYSSGSNLYLDAEYDIN